MDLNYITAMGVVDVCKLHFYCSFDICLFFFMSGIMHFTIFPFIGREEQERTRTNIKIIKSLRVYSKAFITFLNLVSSSNICVNKHSEKRYLYSYLCIYLSIYIYIYICLFVYLSLSMYISIESWASGLPVSRPNHAINCVRKDKPTSDNTRDGRSDTKLGKNRL